MILKSFLLIRSILRCSILASLYFNAGRGDLWFSLRNIEVALFCHVCNCSLYTISVKAVANEDTLLPTQMFSRFPARETFVADTNFVSLFRNILCLQQMFPSLRSPRNIIGNSVSATMCPRLPGPLACENSHPSSLLRHATRAGSDKGLLSSQAIFLLKLK